MLICLQEQGDELHIQEDHPVSQYVFYDRNNGKTRWHISLLNAEAHELFVPILKNVESIDLHSGMLEISEKRHCPEKELRDIILEAKNDITNRAVIRFVSPTSFKQNGKYVIYPQEKLIIHSLINRWNSFCPDYSLADDDAVAMLENGICITDYSLHTSRFHLKNTSIPGFSGKITLSARLSPPVDGTLVISPAMGTV